MVWAMQSDRPNSGGDRSRARRKDPGGEAEHRRQPGRDTPLRRHEHSDTAPLQGRGASAQARRRQAEEPTPSGDLRVPLGVDEVLPLQEGRSGPAVTDIRTRLEALDIFTFEDEPGIFGPATRVAVEAFQHRRGLRVDGICGPQTWNTLVEAGFRMGSPTLI